MIVIYYNTVDMLQDKKTEIYKKIIDEVKNTNIVGLYNYIQFF